MAVQTDQMAVAEEDLDEPADEALDPAAYAFPVVTPQDTPTAADKQEVDGWLSRNVYMPVTVR